MPITAKPVVDTKSLTVRPPKELLELFADDCRFLDSATDRTYAVTEAFRLVVGRDRRYRKFGIREALLPLRRPPLPPAPRTELLLMTCLHSARQGVRQRTGSSRLPWTLRKGRFVYRQFGQIGLAVTRPPAPCPLHGEGRTYRDTGEAHPDRSVDRSSIVAVATRESGGAPRIKYLRPWGRPSGGFDPGCARRNQRLAGDGEPAPQGALASGYPGCLTLRNRPDLRVRYAVGNRGFSRARSAAPLRGTRARRGRARATRSAEGTGTDANRGAAHANSLASKCSNSGRTARLSTPDPDDCRRKGRALQTPVSRPFRRLPDAVREPENRSSRLRSGLFEQVRSGSLWPACRQVRRVPESGLPASGRCRRAGPSAWPTRDGRVPPARRRNLLVPGCRFRSDGMA